MRRTQKLLMALKYTHAVVHYAEIGLKLGNRGFFEKKLMQNIAKKFSKNAKNVTKLSGKFLVELNCSEEKAIELLEKIPGIANFSPCLITETDLKKIKEKSLEIASRQESKTFKVITSRSWKQFPITSQEISAQVGEYIIAKTNLKVDLKEPELKMFIEVNQKQSCIYEKKYEGIGGLPSGTSGKIVSLLSGGIDSPVSSYLMMKRGARVILVHCMNKTLLTQAIQNKIEDIAKKLGEYQATTKLYIVPFEEIQKEIIKFVPAKYRMIIYRRFMLRIAEKIMRKEKAKAIITGDSLSQVASQTIENLNAVRQATNATILSPLIGMNKQEIINISEDIGTYELSILPYPDCCSFLVAKHPELRGDAKQMKQLEQELDINMLVKTSIQNSKIFRF